MPLSNGEKKELPQPSTTRRSQGIATVKAGLPLAELVLGGQWRSAKEPTLFQQKIHLPQRHDDHDGHNENSKSTDEGKSRPFYPVILCFPVVAVVVVVSSW